jgi:hypothetical protein
MAAAGRGARRRRGSGVIGLVLGVTLALAGCAAGDATAPVQSPTAGTSASTPPLLPADGDVTVAPVAEASEDSQASAIEVAERAVAAYARPGLSYDEWINGLYPYLSQSGAAAYEDTDPTRIPVRQVTGTGAVLPASTEIALIVEVPTDNGPYNVALSRPSSDATWLADRIRPAKS